MGLQPEKAILAWLEDQKKVINGFLLISPHCNPLSYIHHWAVIRTVQVMKFVIHCNIIKVKKIAYHLLWDWIKSEIVFGKIKLNQTDVV